MRWEYVGLSILLLVLINLVSAELAVRNKKSGLAKNVNNVYSRCTQDIFGNSKITQDNPELVKYIQKYHLSPPSNRPYPEELLETEDPNVYGKEVSSIFKGKTSGYFVEAGAHDGFLESKTLQLERAFNWTGLLIEASSFVLPHLRLANRRAWIAGVCLSTEPHPQKLRFMCPQYGENLVTLSGYAEDAPCHGCRYPKTSVYAGPVECFSLYSLLLAVNQTVVDYLSLDMEGVELSVLKNIPFDKLTVKVLSVEFKFIPGGRKALEQFLKSKGYIVQFRRKIEVFAVQKDFIQEYGVNSNKKCLK